MDLDQVENGVFGIPKPKPNPNLHLNLKKQTDLDHVEDGVIGILWVSGLGFGFRVTRSKRTWIM